MELKKGIKFNPNRNGCGKRESRYYFYFRYKEEKCRNTIMCKDSAVNSIFDRWKEENIRRVDAAIAEAAELERIKVAEAERAKQPWLFEILDQYLGYVYTHKKLGQYNHEVMVIGVFKEYIKKNMLLEDFKRHHAEDFIQWRQTHVVVQYDNTKNRGQLSNSTINRNIAVLSYFFNWCIRRELYSNNNPFSMTKLPERNYREVMLKTEQIDVLLKTADDIRYMFHTVISILLLTGMRRGELFTLDWSEVNLDTNFIILSQHKTKGKKRRAIPISPVLREILLSLNNENNCGLVIKGYTVNQLAKDWQKLLSRITFRTINDGTDLRVHDLRHIYSQSLLNTGVSLEDIQSLLGHQDFSTTQRRYAQFARPDLLDKGSKIDNVIRIKRVG